MYRFLELFIKTYIITKSLIIIDSPGVVKIALKTLPVRHGEIRQTSTLPDNLNVISEVEDGRFPQIFNITPVVNHNAAKIQKFQYTNT